MPLASSIRDKKIGIQHSTSCKLSHSSPGQNKITTSSLGFCWESRWNDSFEDVNNVILERIEIIKNYYVIKNKFELTDTAIREEYSINRSFCRGVSTHAQNRNIPELVIETQNRWRKFEREQVKIPKLGMLETYADIRLLVITLIRYF